MRFTDQDEALTELFALMDATPGHACAMAGPLRSVADEPERGIRSRRAAWATARFPEFGGGHRRVSRGLALDAEDFK